VAVASVEKAEYPIFAYFSPIFIILAHLTLICDVNSLQLPLLLERERERERMISDFQKFMLIVIPEKRKGVRKASCSL